ncbi:lysosome-associated membrane glycoprotein 2-like [Acanthaster planci]|uniref:Lysosome-associated membrane glycoprotein 5 n=1 Tax=Acanthaster planci TaxID=133434 RepID=A0A8B7YRU4_ACAPL|nr:lysosome-associated membrane glycoprotein 2-like [Acanthaster planci]
MDIFRSLVLLLVAYLGAVSHAAGTTEAPKVTDAPSHTLSLTSDAHTTNAASAATTGATVRTTATRAPKTTPPPSQGMVTDVVITGTSPTNHTTGSTKGPTTPTAEPTPTPEPTPRYSVNNSAGEPCMLLNFNATMKVKYETKNQGLLEADIPIMNTTFFEGFCEADEKVRNFTLYYPNKDFSCAQLVLFFNESGASTYYNRQGISVRYIEPCFQSNAVKYNELKEGHYPPSYVGTIGKSFKCDSVACYSKKGHFTVMLYDILIQPFAQKSKDKGHFGEVETCPETVPTTGHPKSTPGGSVHPPPSKASPSNAGMIAGIVIGVLVAVAIIVGVAVYVVRKRRLMKNISYGNL